MTLKEFMSKENMEKDNPFEGCEVLEKIKYSDYVNMTKAAVAALFNEEDNSFRPLSREMMVRFAVMTIMLNLTNEDNEYKDIDELFDTLICSDFYNRFYNEVALKVAPNMDMVVKGINDYIDHRVKYTMQSNNTDAKVLDTLIGLLGSESFMQLLEQIPIDESEAVTEGNGEV